MKILPYALFFLQINTVVIKKIEVQFISIVTINP